MYQQFLAITKRITKQKTISVKQVKTMKKRVGLRGSLCSLALLTFASQLAITAEQAGNANVEIVSAITISEDTQIDFGQIINLDGTCNMATGGTLSGTAGMGCTGTETPATFTISGTTGAVVDINVTAGASVDGVTYNPVVDGVLTRTLTGGQASVDVIGNIVLASATDGIKDIAYTFTANYQ